MREWHVPRIVFLFRESFHTAGSPGLRNERHVLLHVHIILNCMFPESAMHIIACKIVNLVLSEMHFVPG